MNPKPSTLNKNMGKLTFNLEEFQDAAIRFRGDLLKVPMFALREMTQYMTVRTGIRGSELVGKQEVDAEFAPYKANRKTEVNLDLTLRVLQTYFGSLNADFDPNDAISTLLGHMASQAMEGKLASTPTAKDVLGMIAKSASEKLYNAFWNAVRNPSGTKTIDLFDGFDTITAKEITSGDLAEKKGNFIDIADDIDVDNILDVCDLILDTMHPKLRAQEVPLYCTQSFSDMYNRAYKKASGGIAYNTTFDQQFVEGSNRRLRLVPLPNKEGSPYLTIATRRTMLVGFDQESDTERVNVKDYAPDTLTFMMRMFFGEQYETLDPTQILIVKHGKPATKPTTPPASGGDSEAQQPGTGTSGQDQGTQEQE